MTDSCPIGSTDAATAKEALRLEILLSPPSIDATIAPTPAGVCGALIGDEVEESSPAAGISPDWTAETEVDDPEADEYALFGSSITAVDTTTAVASLFDGSLIAVVTRPPSDVTGMASVGTLASIADVVDIFDDVSDEVWPGEALVDTRDGTCVACAVLGAAEDAGSAEVAVACPRLSVTAASTVAAANAIGGSQTILPMKAVVHVLHAGWMLETSVGKAMFGKKSS